MFSLNKKLKGGNSFISISDAQKEYKEKRTIWIWTTILCAGFPFIAPIISSISNHSFNFLNIINNGDIILLTYSIIIPTFIDLLKIKNKNSSRYIIWTMIFAVVIFSDLYIYSTIKNPTKYLNENKELVVYDNTIQNIIFSIVMFISSLIVCDQVMKIIYNCNIECINIKEETQND